MELNYIWKERKRIMGMPISFTVYSLTEDRFFKEVGLISTNEDQTQLYRVNDITMRRTFSQKLFGLGTIILMTSDPSNPEIHIENIPEPRKVSELINKLVDQEKKKRNVVFYESSTHSPLN